MADSLVQRVRALETTSGLTGLQLVELGAVGAAVAATAVAALVVGSPVLGFVAAGVAVGGASSAAMAYLTGARRQTLVHATLLGAGLGLLGGWAYAPLGADAVTGTMLVKSLGSAEVMGAGTGVYEGLSPQLAPPVAGGKAPSSEAVAPAQPATPPEATAPASAPPASTAQSAEKGAVQALETLVILKYASDNSK